MRSRKRRSRTPRSSCASPARCRPSASSAHRLPLELSEVSVGVARSAFHSEHRLIDRDVHLEIGSRATAAHLSRRLPPAPATVTEPATYALTEADGAWVLQTPQGARPPTDLPQACTTLLEHLNRLACFTSPSHVTVHAGVASLGGRAVLFPAAAGAGKTTLVTALVRGGLSYLSDEVAAVDPATGRLTAFPKWLALKRGSWRLFPELEPDLPPELDGLSRTIWYVAPEDIRAGAAVREAEPAVIVLPEHRPHATTSLEPIHRAEALTTVLEQAFNLEILGSHGVDALAELVQRCSCYRLVHSGLDEAVAAILGALDAR